LVDAPTNWTVSKEHELKPLVLVQKPGLVSNPEHRLLA